MESKINVTAVFAGMSVQPNEESQRITLALTLEEDTDIGVLGRAKKNGTITLHLIDSKNASRNKSIPVSVSAIGYITAPRCKVTLHESDLDERGLLSEDLWKKELRLSAEVDPALFDKKDGDQHPLGLEDGEDNVDEVSEQDRAAMDADDE